MGEERQQELNIFDRGRRLRLIDEAKIPKRPRTNPGTLKHVLRVIESFARDQDGQCWASVRTIAERCCCSTSTVNTATKTLRDLHLIATARRGKYRDRCAFTIVWGELAMLGPDYESPANSASQPLVELAREPRDQSVTVNKQSMTVNKQSVTVGQQSVTVVAPPEAQVEAQTEPPTKPAAAWLVVGVELQKAGISKRFDDLIRQVRDVLGETPAEFLIRLGEGLATIHEPANAGKLQKPSGALFWWLWNRGGWPPGVTLVDPLAARRQREAKAARALRCLHERVFSEAITRGRRAGLSDEQIVRGLLDDGVPREFLVEAGWLVEAGEVAVSTPGREDAKTQRETTR